VAVRDLALWVNAGLPARALLDTIAEAVKADARLAIVRDVCLFDVWGGGQADAPASAPEKSLAFRFWLQDTEVTLDDARVADCMARILNALAAAHGARPRA
jgi:phenylalanyl-tRNA synthetase beta chain